MVKTMTIRLAVLDVGHGNTTVIHGDGIGVVVDVRSMPTLGDYLLAHEVNQIRSVFISHSDEDHFEGTAVLLLNTPEFVVDAVYANVDHGQVSRGWEALKRARRYARKYYGTRVQNSLDSTDPGKLDLGDIRLSVLAPAPDLVTFGPGGDPGEGLGRLTRNALSAVILVEQRGVGLALLCGDLDAVGLRYLRDEIEDERFRAQVLVYPHHGGRSGRGAESLFTEELCALVQARYILFSYMRGGPYRLPRPEVISAVRRVLPGAYLACTQLSRHCCDIVPSVGSVDPGSVGSGGADMGTCCAGSMEFVVRDAGGRVEVEAGPWEVAHRRFVRERVGTSSALCLRPSQQGPADTR
jgi:beta-lactamase superfamily II metal-dependent hydrolase